MAQKSIVMIAGRSLLVQGMASRWPNRDEEYKLQVLNPEDEDWKNELAEAKPNVIVMDAHDPGVQRICPLAELIWDLPEVTMMLLHSEHSDLQIISSKRIPIKNSEALLRQIMASDDG